MKKYLMLLISLSLFAEQSESFTLEKPKKTRESKRSVLEDIGQMHADIIKDIADALDALAQIQQEIIRLQRSSIDAALDVVSGEYCPQASNSELMQKRDEVRTIQEKVVKLKRAADQLKRSMQSEASKSK